MNQSRRLILKFYLLMIIFIFFVSCGSDSDTNNTSLDLYIDGALDGSHTIVPIAAYTGPGAIAADGECAQKFIGSIDEVAVWNTSLTAQDIQDVYNEQKP